MAAPTSGTAATQVVVEVLRGQIAGAARVSQVVVEVLVPYVPPGNDYDKSASLGLVLTPSGSEVADLHHAASIGLVLAPAASETSAFVAVAALGLVLTPDAAEAGDFHAGASLGLVLAPAADVIDLTHNFYVSASLGLVLAPTASETAGFGADAGLDLVLTPAASEYAALKVLAWLRLDLTPTARLKRPEIIFGENYRGRYQQGHEYPAFVPVRDGTGAIAAPTAQVEARSYDLDTAALEATAELRRLRRSRSPGVFDRPVRLGVEYPPGRYGVLGAWQVGAFVGEELAVFEVNRGGDPAGQVIMAMAHARPGGYRVLAQVDSGAVLLGWRPRGDQP